MMNENIVKCGNPECGMPLEESSDTRVENRKPCPKCDSLARAFELAPKESLDLHEMMDVKKKSRDYPSKKNTRVYLRQGDELFVAENRWIFKIRRIDKDAEPAWYFERVEDPRTGEVIHQNSEFLADHYGHGSAKKNQEGDA